MSDDAEIETWVDEARRGDGASFGRLVGRYRSELLLHAYRMLGRYDDAEDAVQDCLVLAWRGIADFEGRSSVRSWLYRITTNTCLNRRNAAERRRRILSGTSVRDGVTVPVAATVPWLQALPDEVPDAIAANQPELVDHLLRRETIEIAFVAALQHLPDRQRAVLVLRDLAGWSARETAEQLDITVSSANSVLHRARTTMRKVLGPDRDRWPRVDREDHDQLVRQYVAAIESGDDSAIGELLAADVVVSHQPYAGQGTAEVGWYSGREAVIEAWAPALHGSMALDLRLRPVRVNGQPAVASYGRLPGTDEVHRAFGLAVLRVVDGKVAEVTNLAPDQFPLVGLPIELGPTTR